MTGNVIEPVPKTTVVQDYMPQSPGNGAEMVGGDAEWESTSSTIPE